jgi:signal transduction histidine kinase/ligand-binding sensor domain-containing protein
VRRPGVEHLFLILYVIWAFSDPFVPRADARILPFKSYSTSDGLAHDRVSRIVRDSRGFLWFCTGEGLSRFDGYEFRNYTKDDGLPHRAILDLLETRAGEFWIATNDGIALFNPGGISKREQKDGQMSDNPMFRVLKPENLDVGAGTWSIQDLMEDHDGTVWIGSSHGLYRLVKGQDWSIERFEVRDAAENKSREFTRLLEDRTGAIWAGTQSGLYRVLPDRSRAETVDKSLSVQSFYEAPGGDIWVGSGDRSKGLHIFAYQGEFVRETGVFGKTDGLGDDFWMNAMLETSDGRLFVGTGNYLSEYTPGDRKGGAQFRTLANEGVVALGEDQSGNVWYSTNSSGVKRLAGRGFINYGKADGLSDDVITSIIDGGDGETYVLSSGSKIDRFNGKGFDAIAPREMLSASWGKGQITFRDHTGAWWVAGEMGLQRYPAVSKIDDLKSVRALKTYTVRDGLYSNEVFRLFEDSRGDIWITLVGDVVDTLMRWDRATDTFQGYTAGDGVPERNGPTAFGEDLGGNIWIGFYDGGLLRFRAGKFEAFTAVDNLPAGYIHNIFRDSRGRMWIATSAGGVVRIDDPTTEAKPRLINITTLEGLSSNQATCTTEDNYGRIYISTGRGINRIDPQNGRIKIFTMADGLPENIISQCLRDAEGALWFGTIKGLARYVPATGEKSEPPPVFLANVKVNGETVKKLSELGETEVSGIDLASDQRQLQVDFFSLGFGIGEAIRYQYKLDGIDQDWSPPLAQRTVNLNLSPGRYRFLVRAVNADGLTSESPASISFAIARPVWQRWWFLLLLALSLAGLVYMLYSYRLQRLLELEKVRTRIATDLHDDIGASLSKIAILSEVAHQHVPPESIGIQQPLQEIAGTSRDLVDSMSDIVWAINPERDQLSDLLQRMRNLAGEMTELADIGLRVDLHGMEGIGDIPLGADMRREIFLIFKETINNMVKHSACDRAVVEFGRENDTLVISVRDDGKGFEPAAAGNGNGTRGGNGLPNMRRRASGLGGTYEIESGPGKGTRVVLSVPLNSGLRRFSLKNFYRKN